MSSAVKQHLADAKTAGFERHLYYRDGDTRPALRGQFFASFKWEWTTFVTLYLVATSMVSASINYPLKARNKASAVQQPEFVIIRAVAALSYVMLVFVGDKYHNSDVHFRQFHHRNRALHGSVEITSALHYELYWLRWDFFTIALIQASTFQVWVAHYGYIEGHVIVAAMMWIICILVVLVAVVFLDTTRDAKTVYEETTSPNALNAIKALLGLQFVSYIYLVSTGPAACSWTAGVYYIFIPGFISYAARFPEDRPSFGAHEVFHVSVLRLVLGTSHVGSRPAACVLTTAVFIQIGLFRAFIVLGIFSSMFCDVVNLSLQCGA